MLRNLLTLQQISQKSISTASSRQVASKVPELQKHFQEDNGIPVYLKGGTMDAMLYQTTITLSVFGTGYLLYVLFNAAMPKKNN